MIGPKGLTKQRIEEETGVQILVDSKEGEVSIDESKAEDPSMALKTLDIVKAIGRGFSEERALRLFDPEVFFRSVDIRDFAGKNRKRIAQIKGRLIGTKGKTRHLKKGRRLISRRQAGKGLRRGHPPGKLFENQRKQKKRMRIRIRKNIRIKIM